MPENFDLIRKIMETILKEIEPDQLRETMRRNAEWMSGEYRGNEIVVEEGTGSNYQAQAIPAERRKRKRLTDGAIRAMRRVRVSGLSWYETTWQNSQLFTAQARFLAAEQTQVTERGATRIARDATRPFEPRLHGLRVKPAAVVGIDACGRGLVERRLRGIGAIDDGKARQPHLCQTWREQKREDRQGRPPRPCAAYPPHHAPSARRRPQTSPGTTAPPQSGSAAHPPQIGGRYKKSRGAWLGGKDGWMTLCYNPSDER